MKRTYYLFNPGEMVRKDNTLKFTPIIANEDRSENYGQPRYIPIENVSDFFVFGSLKASSSLFNFLGKSDVAVHFFDYYENYSGSFMPKDFLLAGKVIISQVNHYQKTAKRMIIARKFIEGAAFNMVKNLQYYNRRGKDMEPLIELINGFISQISSTESVAQLMGIEGNIRQTYYEAFNLILNDFEMGSRSKQPPQNEVNALISFGNMMCYSFC